MVSLGKEKNTVRLIICCIHSIVIFRFTATEAVTDMHGQWWELTDPTSPSLSTIWCCSVC